MCVTCQLERELAGQAQEERAAKLVGEEEEKKAEEEQESASAPASAPVSQSEGVGKKASGRALQLCGAVEQQKFRGGAALEKR